MKIWRICLGIWLVVVGLVAILGLTFQGLPILTGILALAAGITLLIDR